MTMAFTLRTDDELEAALTELAETLRISKQEVIRRSVLELRDRSSHRSKVEDVAAKAIVDYADALDRLGTV